MSPHDFCANVKDAIADAFFDTGKSNMQIARDANRSKAATSLFKHSTESPSISTIYHYCKAAGVSIEIRLQAPGKPERIVRG